MKIVALALLLLALSTCATAPVSFASGRNAEVYNLILRFKGSPGYLQYERDFKSYSDCRDFANGRIFEADVALIAAANPQAIVELACGVEVD